MLVCINDFFGILCILEYKCVCINLLEFYFKFKTTCVIEKFIDADHWKIFLEK